MVGRREIPPPGSGLHRLLEEDLAGLYHKALGWNEFRYRFCSVGKGGYSNEEMVFSLRLYQTFCPLYGRWYLYGYWCQSIQTFWWVFILGLFFFCWISPTYFLSQGIHQIDDAGVVRRDGDIVAGLGLLAALIASKKANPFIKECLDYYGSRHFIQEDGSLYVDVINPGIMAMLATKYGFRYKDEDQLLDGNMMVYSSSIFAGDPATRSKESYSMHYCDGSWREKTLKTRMKDYIKRILYKKRK